MRNLTALPLLLFLLAGFLNAQNNRAGDLGNWAQWRGPYNNGVAPEGNPPIEWSETKNIKWKSEIPGIGHATPIIWEDQIILLSAIQTDELVKPEEPEEGVEGTTT